MWVSMFGLPSKMKVELFKPRLMILNGVESEIFGLEKWCVPAQNGLYRAGVWIWVGSHAHAQPNGLQAILLAWKATSGKCFPGNLVGLPQISSNLDFFGPNNPDCLDCLARDPPSILPPTWRQTSFYYLSFAMDFQALTGWVGSPEQFRNSQKYFN
jgi:hypothetical protein